jgi:hypothetical protein
VECVLLSKARDSTITGTAEKTGISPCFSSKQAWTPADLVIRSIDLLISGPTLREITEFDISYKGTVIIGIVGYLTNIWS